MQERINQLETEISLRYRRVAILYSESMFARNEPMRKLEAVISLGYRRAAILYSEPILTKHWPILLGAAISLRYPEDGQSFF